jgi:hypothetical protein
MMLSLLSEVGGMMLVMRAHWERWLLQWLPTPSPLQLLPPVQPLPAGLGLHWHHLAPPPQ